MFKISEKNKKVYIGWLIFVIVIGFFAPINYSPNKKLISGQIINTVDANWLCAISPALCGLGLAKDVAVSQGSSVAKEFAKEFLETVFSWIGSFLIMFAGWVLGLAGLLLNYTLDYTIVEMAQRVRDLPVITDAWGTFRDLANIFFIFIILYIAIMTILRMDTATTKKLLVHVIIIALLINFSLFFTKALIDASNIVATSFYNQIEEVGVSNTGKDLGLSGAFMRQLGLESAFNLAGAEKLLSTVNGPLNILLVAILSFFLFMVVAFVFAAAAILLIIRFVVLIFLMILSPLAFAAMALPKDDWSKKWWDALISQAIFAPIFLALIWVTILVLNGLTNGGTNLGESLTRIIPDGLSGSNEEGFVEGLLKDKMAIIFNFIVVIGMAAFSIVAAKLIGVQGGEKAVKWASNSAKRMGSAPARHLVGRGATMADRALGGTRFGQTAVGSMLRAPLTGLSKSKFGGVGPSGSDISKKAKKRRETYDNIEAEKKRKEIERKAEQKTKQAGEQRVNEQQQKLRTEEDRLDSAKTAEISAAKNIISPDTDAIVAGIEAKYVKAIEDARTKHNNEVAKIREEKINPEILESVRKQELSEFENTRFRVPIVTLNKKRRKGIVEKIRKAKIGEKIEGPKDSWEDMIEKYLKDKNKDKKVENE